MSEKPEEQFLGTKEVAAKLKIDPKTLRKHLRAISGKSPGERYQWKATDPFLKKLPEMIKAEEAKESAKKPKR